MIYHFIFGLSENFNDKPFQYFHFLNIKSCYITQNKPTIYIHCIYEPVNNIWWDVAKEFCEIITYTNLPDIVYNCNNKKVCGIEHQCDIFRLLILQEYGGVYADIDTFFYKPFFPHFSDNQCVMGLEVLYHIDDEKLDINGACNSLIIANKQSEFISIWLESFKTDYDDCDWNKMAVRKPYELSQLYSNLIHIEPPSSFHKYNWSTLFYMNHSEQYAWYTKYVTDKNIFSKHMSESKIYDTLKNITNESLKSGTSTFAKMCQNINGLL